MNTAPTTFTHLPNTAANFVNMDVNECSPAYTAAVAFDGRAMYPAAAAAAAAQLPEGGFQTHRDFSAPDLERNDRIHAEPFVCDECNRQFLRHCDLNKHAKTHTRPFKCPVPGCKYYHLGWPTEKELERHHNDVHSSRPQTFTCRFQPCPYTSKRESNLKQHMEKTHGWKYVRSRSSRSHRCSAPGSSDCFSPDDTQQRHNMTLAPPIRTKSLNGFHDFVLFPEVEPQALSAPAAQYPDGPEDPWDSYVPWASPPTRGENLSKFLQNMESIIKVPSPLPLDPQLTQAQYVPATPATVCYTPHQPEHLSVQQPLANVPLKLSCSPPVFALATPREDWSTAANYTTSNGGNSSITTAAGLPVAASGSAQPAAAATSQSLRRSRPIPNENDGASDEDDESDEEPPQKRFKHLPDDNFDERKMPCPFWLADPDFFNRENQEKFSPCHTKHKEVSTIVRHLGRPAHQLFTDQRCVHSFDVEELEDEQPRPKAGICKLCWRIFRDRREFDEHISQACTKVSRGKREKFFQLYYAFCTDGEQAQREPSRPRQQSHAASAAPDALDVDMEDSDEGAESPEAAHGAEDPVKVEDGLVTASEHRNLEERVQVVETHIQMLQHENQTLSNRCKLLETQVKQIIKFISTRSRPAEQSTSAFHVRLDNTPLAPAQGSSSSSGGRLPRAAQETASLVEGMDSRHFVMSRNDLIDELVRDTKRTETGLSSGSDKSSVRHVPTSPRYPARKDGDTQGKLQTPPQTVRTSDSGYAGSSTKGKASVLPEATAEQPTPVPAPAVATDAPTAQPHFDADQDEEEYIYTPAGVTDFDRMWPDNAN